MKRLILLLLCSLPAFATCTATGNVTFGSATNWTGVCTGGAVTGAPGPTNPVVVGGGYTLTINSTCLTSGGGCAFVSLAMGTAAGNGNNGFLVTDGLGDYTITFSGTSGITFGYLLGQCASLPCNIIDTSAATASHQVHFIFTSVTQPGIYTSIGAQYGGAKLYYTTIQVPTGQSSMSYPDSNNVNSIDIEHVKLIGGNGLSLSGVKNLTVTNVTRTGGSGTGSTGLLSLPSIYSGAGGSCSISGLTDIDPVGSIQTLKFNGTLSPYCTTVSEIASSGDTGATYDTQGVVGGTNAETAAVTLSNVLCKDYYTGSNGSNTSCVSNIAGGSSAQFTVTNFASENLAHAIFTNADYITAQNGYGSLITSGYTAIQGIFFHWPSASTTHTNFGNLVGVQFSTTGAASITHYYINNTSANITTVLNHLTSIIASGLTGNTIGIGLGEGGASGTTALISPTVLKSSIFDGGFWPVETNQVLNVFATSLTGSVGVCCNNVVNLFAGGTQYKKLQPATNFDNGTATVHPNALYGDTAIPNWWLDPYRTLAKCDEYIGNLVPGTGTAEHLFTQISNRWNGTNGNYTVAAAYACMWAGTTPQNGALATAGYSGDYSGHMLPNIIAAGAAAQ